MDPPDPTPPVLRVAVPSPLRQLFDYLPPAELPAALVLAPGQRIEVPFGKRTVIGLLIEITTHSDYPPAQLQTGPCRAR